MSYLKLRKLPGGGISARAVCLACGRIGARMESASASSGRMVSLPAEPASVERRWLRACASLARAPACGCCDPISGDRGDIVLEAMLLRHIADDTAFAAGERMTRILSDRLTTADRHFLDWMRDLELQGVPPGDAGLFRARLAELLSMIP